MKSILDPRFKYVNSVSTDIRKTFRRVRKEMAKPTSSFPGIYFPIPENVDEMEFAECQRLMHQDLEHAYPWEK